MILDYLIVDYFRRTKHYFLALILPFPLIITVASFSVCFKSFSPPGSGKINNSSSEKNTRNGKPNKTILTDSIQPTNARNESQSPEYDESTKPKRTGMSILLVIQFMICILFLYDYHFNFIFHLPIGHVLVSMVLQKAVRVQCLLLMVSQHVLPKEIICSLVSMCKPQPSSKYQCPKKIAHSNYFLNFFQIICFRTLKH